MVGAQPYEVYAKLIEAALSSPDRESVIQD
jgi:hypothetical protein